MAPTSPCCWQRNVLSHRNWMSTLANGLMNCKNPGWKMLEVPKRPGDPQHQRVTIHHLMIFNSLTIHHNSLIIHDIYLYIIHIVSTSICLNHVSVHLSNSDISQPPNSSQFTNLKTLLGSSKLGTGRPLIPAMLGYGVWHVLHDWNATSRSI